MRTKVLALELSEKLVPLWAGNEYDSFWILVRYHTQPIGWLWVSVPSSSVPIVSTERLRKEIATQLGWNFSHTIIGKCLSSEERSDQPLEPISVVVYTNHCPEQLQCCLEALLSSDYPNYEVIVVDSAPSNKDIAEKAAQFPVRYVCEHQLGLSWARNRGIAEARYDIVAFIQDSMRVDRLWLYKINKAFAERDVAAVTGLTAPAELETTAQFLYELSCNSTEKSLRRKVIRQDTFSEIDLIKEKYGICINAAFRRNLFTQIGLFNPVLDIGINSGSASDMELLHRLINQGYTLIYDPCILVWNTHRRHLSIVHRQIYDQARSLGFYLLTGWHNRSIKLVSILKLFINTLTLSHFVHLPFKLPRYTALIKLAGILTSPFVYMSRQ